jgi:predicted AAA+ superfamily ATPase
MYRRFIQDLLLEALKDSPVVLVSGARQVGKTTLVQNLPAGVHAAQYISLDDATYLSAATSDPGGFIAGLSGRVIIDEIQRAPHLLSAIKLAVDRDRKPGQFLLTGSANLLQIPRLSESLAGRMEILTLWPLSQAEIEGAGSGFVDKLFETELRLPAAPPLARQDLLRRILAGGYPEPRGRSSDARRRAWFGSYLTTILQCDVRDIAHIEGLTELPRLLALLGSRMGNMLNLAEISRSVGISYSTLNRYMGLLQATFLLQLLQPWSANLGLRLTRSPKILLNDSGLAASLIGLDADRLRSEGTLLGPVLENFVVVEMLKAAGIGAAQPKPYHYRTQAGAEVDLVLEAPNGCLVGIEVKASGTAGARDFRGLRSLADATGSRFVRGIVVYTGDKVVPFGERLHAVPIQTMWSLPN